MTLETFSRVPLAHIVASLTNPRKHFQPDRLAELAESIRASGVHQPVLLRALPGARLAETAHMDPRPQYELVSGERRLRASTMAEMDSIPAVIRPLTDSEVLEIQVIENLQRDDLHPLEEAEGYERLMHAHEPPLTAEQIGDRIGKSRSYVYARLKLLNLCPEGQQAMHEGWLDPSTALLVARAPSSKMQIDILGNLREYDGTPISHREASALIQRQYMLRLTEARFNITDATLIASAGSCKACPKRTGADPDLFADVSGVDVCTDPACFRAKADAHTERTLKTARESGAQIIEGREAKALIQHAWSDRVDGFLRLDDAMDSPTSKPLRSIIGQLLEEEGVQPTLVANPHREGELIAVIDHATASRLLAKKGHQDQAEAIEAQASQSAKAAEEAQKAKDKERFEKAWRMEVLRQAWAKISVDQAAYCVPDDIIRHLATSRMPNGDGCKELCKLLDLGKVAPAEAIRDWITNHDEPEKALALMVMFQDREWQGWKGPNAEHNTQLIALATDALGDSHAVDDIKAEVKKAHAAEIRARNKVQAEKAAGEAAKADLPLNPAAQASGGAGGSKLKKTGTPAAPKRPKTSAEDALQSIAAAMQGMESEPDGCAVGEETPGDCARGQGTEPVGCAEGQTSRATTPGAGAADAVPGAGEAVAIDASSAPAGAAGEGRQVEEDAAEPDPLLQQVHALVIESGKASISYVQRKLQIGYNRASRLLEDLEKLGLVGPMGASGMREVLQLATDAQGLAWVPGARFEVIGEQLTRRRGNLISNPASDMWLVQLDGLTAEYQFEQHELRLVSEDAPPAEPVFTDFDRALQLVQQAGKVSVRLLKEGMGVGTTKALALIDQLEAAGIVSACGERGVRTVLVGAAVEGGAA